MRTKNLLRKSATAYGNTREELDKDIKDFRPFIRHIKTDEITILHFGEQDRNGYFRIRKLNLDNVSTCSENLVLGEETKATRDVLNKRYKICDELIDELYGFNGDQEIGYAIMADGALYIPTRDFMATFCNSLGAGFNKLNTGRDLLRDLYIISHLFDAKAQTLNFVCKRDPNCHYKVFRVFAAFSGTYELHSSNSIQYVIDNVIDRGYSLLKYTMTHGVTDVDFYDPEEKIHVAGKTVFAGVRLSWSDVGDASFSLNSTLMVDGSITLTNIKRSLHQRSLIFSDKIYQDLVNEFFPLLIKETTLFRLDDLSETKKLTANEYKGLLKEAGINKKAVKDCNLENMSIKEFVLMILSRSAVIGTDTYDRTSKILQLEQKVNQVIWTFM